MMLALACRGPASLMMGAWGEGWETKTEKKRGKRGTGEGRIGPGMIAKRE